MRRNGLKFRTLSLRQRLYVLTAVALAPALVILLYNEITMRRSREAEVHRSALRIGELVSLEIQRIMDGSEGILRVLARAPSVRTFDTGSCVAFVADVTAESPQFLSISAIDADGFLRCRSVMPGTEMRLNELEYFQEVMTTGNFVVGGYRLSNFSGEPTLPLAVPIRNDAGNFNGVVVASLSLTWLNDQIAERLVVTPATAVERVVTGLAE